MSGNQVSTEVPTEPRQTINMERIAALATRAGSMVEQIRGMLLAPEARKIAPTYSTAQLGALCGVEKANIAWSTHAVRRQADLRTGPTSPVDPPLSPTVTLKSLEVQDLQAFQAARFGMKSPDLSVTPRHALRPLRLIDRALRHRAAQSDDPPIRQASDRLAENPHVRYAEAAGGDPLLDFLSVTEATHLIAFLSSARPRPGVSGARRDAHAAFT